MNAFIGRQNELAAVRQLLDAHRLLTLTGPGGCGKTRLALQAAGELTAAYRDGVWLIEFAALQEPALAPQTVAARLGLAERPGEDLLTTLQQHLQARHMLLLLDNCEHIVAACAQLSAALLAACPQVRLFATSREPLGVLGEVVWRVPPLSLPTPQPWRSPDSEAEALYACQQSEAIQLFVDRAAAAAPGFSLHAQNAGWVADICRRLDGQPLAIELAAARVRAFSVRQIAERLDDRFRLLVSGPRTAPPRQQTLQAALDWSYELLSDDEKTTLQRLAVFAGGWELEAAEAVCASPFDAGQTLNALANLVDKSLVVVEKTPDGPRYHCLETVRQYAGHKLVASGIAAQARDQHLAYYVAWAESSAALSDRCATHALDGAVRQRAR